MFNKKLQEENKRLKKEVSNFKYLYNFSKKNSLIISMNEILGEDINWYDYKELTPPRQREYYLSAQQTLRQEAFNNELKVLMEILLRAAVIDNKDDDVRRLRDVRVALNTLEIFKERLINIEEFKPDKLSTEKDIYKAI